MTLLIFRKTKVYIRLLYISDILIDTANHIFERLREILAGEDISRSSILMPNFTIFFFSAEVTIKKI